MNSSLLHQIALKPSAALFLFLAVHPCPGMTQAMPNRETKTVALTQADLLSLPNWQHERVRGNWIGLDLHFAAGEHITTIKVSLSRDADLKPFDLEVDFLEHK